MKKYFFLMTAAIAALTFSACSDDAVGLSADVNVNELSIDGSCNIYTLSNTEGSDWQIVSTPDWVTPVKTEGSANDAIQVYVESNCSTPLRKGDIKVAYKNGVTRSVATRQSDEQPSWNIQRSYAAGWSFDIRTYKDYRGLRQQIFNTQKMKAKKKNAYRIEDRKASFLEINYGEDISNLQNSMAGKLNLSTDSVNFNTFNLSIQGNFGKNSLNNSQRIFSWFRQIYGEKVAYLNNFDEEDAQEAGWFTSDFDSIRQSVINDPNSEEPIIRLIETYGTHLVSSATLGGCMDYFFSTELSEEFDSLHIDGTIKFGFSKKFNLDINGDVNYEDKFKNIGSETIEKFSILGGDALTLARSVESGSIDSLTIDTWRKSINEGNRYELIDFQLISIAALFPEEASARITDYMRRLYYSELPLTRSAMMKEDE